MIASTAAELLVVDCNLAWVLAHRGETATGFVAPGVAPQGRLVDGEDLATHDAAPAERGRAQAPFVRIVDAAKTWDIVHLTGLHPFDDTFNHDCQI